ncbi:MAG: hypothetical protein ACXWWC_09585 [Chitinophagaceae bacterium]
MSNLNLHKAKAPFFVLTAVLMFTIYAMPLNAQQDIIANKDNTRPESGRQFNSFNLSSFDAVQQNGYNEIQWHVKEEDGINKFIIEYSFDGINFLSGDQALTTNGIYKYEHLIEDSRPLLYRVRTEDITGAISYSGVFLPKGITVSPVQIHNNVITGNVINATAQFPVERLTIVSGNGMQMLAKDINGLKDFIPVAIPSLNRGIYFITFYGNGWKSTSRFVVG